MKENVVREKSMGFAIRIVNLYRFLCDEKKEYVLSKQVLRAGTSIGANMAEADCAISRKDFCAKAYIAFKECSETRYWLELLHRAGFITQEQFESIGKDCEELYRILAAITKTAKENEK